LEEPASRELQHHKTVAPWRRITRPAGICAAALLIAARAHGFSKHHQDVTRILRVCGLTVTTRVKEFEQTPSANLTLQQFNTVDFEAEADPPIFTHNKIREARAKATQDGNMELLASGALDDPAQGKRAKLWRDAGSKKKNEKHAKFQEMYSSLEKSWRLEVPKPKKRIRKRSCLRLEVQKEKERQMARQRLLLRRHRNQQKQTQSKSKRRKSRRLFRKVNWWYTRVPLNLWLFPRNGNKRTPRQSSVRRWSCPTLLPKKSDKRRISRRKRNLVSRNGKKKCPTRLTWKSITCFATMMRLRIFNKINKDYIEKQARKEQDLLNADKKGVDLVKEDTTQADAHARYTSNRNRKNRRDNGEEPTTEEQLMAAVSNRKISRKINYDALSSIFDDDGGFSTDAVEDTPATEDQMYGSL
jgi:hypothetical protein